jgi:hypothetical protein
MSDVHTGKIQLARLALSDLYLDSEFSEGELEFVVRRLKQTGFPKSEIVRIFEEEVAPAVYFNAFSVAGVWGQFDIEWLEKRIEKNRKRIEFLKRLEPLWSFYLRWMIRPVKEDWKKVQALCETTNLPERSDA